MCTWAEPTPLLPMPVCDGCQLTGGAGLPSSPCAGPTLTMTHLAQGVCTMTAAFLHFFFLSSFCWVLTEAWQSYLAVIGRIRTRLVRKRFLCLGWGKCPSLTSCREHGALGEWGAGLSGQSRGVQACHTQLRSSRRANGKHPIL